MEKNRRILAQLDAAIDKMDLEEINRGLKELSALGNDEILPEEPKLFAARIHQLNKERQTMKKSRKPLRIALIVALVSLLGITAYAAGVMNLFTFVSDDKMVTMRTTESMTEQEAQAFVAEDSATKAPPEAMETPDMSNYTFDNVEQAEREMDMKLILPGALPAMTLDSATGQTIQYGDSLETRTVWLTYSDAAGRMFGITTSRKIVAPGSSVTGYSTNEMDPGSAGTYQSKSGTQYTTLTESDDTGEKVAHMAVATVGEYEYVLVFLGFEQAEREAIIDSADLSAYGADA